MSHFDPAAPAFMSGRGREKHRRISYIMLCVAAGRRREKKSIFWIIAEKVKSSGMISSEYTKNKKRLEKVFFIYYNHHSNWKSFYEQRPWDEKSENRLSYNEV